MELVSVVLLLNQEKEGGREPMRVSLVHARISPSSSSLLVVAGSSVLLFVWSSVLGSSSESSAMSMTSGPGRGGRLNSRKV